MNGKTSPCGLRPHQARAFLSAQSRIDLMVDEELHISDQDLLRAADGELPRRLARIRTWHRSHPSGLRPLPSRHVQSTIASRRSLPRSAQGPIGRVGGQARNGSVAATFAIYGAQPRRGVCLHGALPGRVGRRSSAIERSRRYSEPLAGTPTHARGECTCEGTPSGRRSSGQSS